jgi:hypothetical protein
MKDLPTVKSWTQFTVRYKKGTNIAMWLIFDAWR